jgi:hypothetical protein
MSGLASTFHAIISSPLTWTLAGIFAVGGIGAATVFALRHKPSNDEEHAGTPLLPPAGSSEDEERTDPSLRLSDAREVWEDPSQLPYNAALGKEFLAGLNHMPNRRQQMQQIVRDRREQQKVQDRRESWVSHIFRSFVGLFSPKADGASTALSSRL